MWLIIGYGNTLRSDDRFGMEVCTKLEANIAFSQLTEIIIAHQLTPELSATISNASGVIFIDVSAALPPGQLKFVPLNQELTDREDSMPGSHSVFTHYYTPKTLLKEAQELYGYAPQGWLCTVGAEHLELGEEISLPVKQIIPTAVRFIVDKVLQP